MTIWKDTTVYTDHVLNQGHHISFDDLLRQVVADIIKHVYNYKIQKKLCELFIVLDPYSMHVFFFFFFFFFFNPMYRSMDKTDKKEIDKRKITQYTTF